VHTRREALIKRSITAVARPPDQGNQFLDLRAQELKLQEEAGKTPKLNSARAQQRASDLESRMVKRLSELEQERHLSPAPPVVIGAP